MRILVNDFSGHPFQIELSRELARRGDETLHVYFADNHSTPKGAIAAKEGESPNFQIEGLHIPLRFSKHSLLSRRKADLAYGRAVAARVVQFQPDVVLSANMPLDAQAILLEASRSQKARFVFWLQDIYSFAIRFVVAKKLGWLAGRLAGGYYERMERRLLLQSDAVICIAPAFRQFALDWGVRPECLSVIENWSPLEEIHPTEKTNAWAREHGLEGKFCFMYSGTLGMKHRPELLLALARRLESVPQARLVVIAAGPGADWLREKAQALSGNSLSLLPFQPYERLSEVLGASDLLIALLDSEAGSFAAVPSKILSYLCAGRTLMVAAPPENHVAAVMEQSVAGILVSPDHEEDFVSAALQLMENAALRSRYAANARAYAERSFEIGLIADRFLDIFAAN